MNILFLELDYLQTSHKRAHSACNSVQLAKLMKKYTNQKVYILSNPESALLSHAQKHKIDCLLEPSGFFSSLKLALLLKKHKIDIVHTFDLLSAQILTKALSFASNVKHVHSENRNTEKDDMLLLPAFKKLDACIFTHKSYEGQYKYKFIYQEEHRPVEFYLADIFPIVDFIHTESDNVIFLDEAEIIPSSTDEHKGKADKSFELNIGNKKGTSKKDSLLSDEETSAQEIKEETLQNISSESISLSNKEQVVENKTKHEDFLPFKKSNKKIRFLIPYSSSITDLDTITNALRCFHEYEGHIHKWEAYFVGPDIDVEKILKYTQKYDITDHVVIFLKDLEVENFEKAELCIVSTFKDEYNLEPLFNAWACKKPAIITQRMPYYEEAVNSKTVLIPDLDTALSLSSVMHKLIQETEIRTTLIEHTDSIDVNKLAEKSAQRYENLYTEIKNKGKVK